MTAPDSAPPSSLSGNLSGLRVLVTRPENQAQNFVQRLEAAGAATFKLPSIVIHYQSRSALDTALIERTLQSDLWIFTSVNAVMGALACHLLPPTEESCHKPAIAAIGQVTGQCLTDHAISVDLAPAVNSGSEKFITLFGPKIKSGSRIAIFRGDSGRGELKKQLQQLGASVHYIEVYQRRLPRLIATEAAQLLNDAMPCAISVTSDLGLSNLLQLTPKKYRPLLLRCPVVVNSQRCASLALQCGFKNQIIIADPPGDAGQLTALEKLR